MKPVILYPIGGGGQWLANLIYSLNCQDFNIVASTLNFHCDQWKKTDLISIRHWPNQGPTLEPHTNDVFSGNQAQFIFFINAYVKRWLHHDEFVNLPVIEKFFYLSNDARWRMGNDPAFNNLFRNHISLDADLLFVDPDKFVRQLFGLLDRHNITYANNLDFVLKSIDNFKLTCHVDDHYGNVQSSAWQAWCHALSLEHDIAVDVNIREDFDGFVRFVDCNNKLFKDLTQQHFLTQV